MRSNLPLAGVLFLFSVSTVSACGDEASPESVPGTGVTTPSTETSKAIGGVSPTSSTTGNGGNVSSAMAGASTTRDVPGVETANSGSTNLAATGGAAPGAGTAGGGSRSSTGPDGGGGAANSNSTSAGIVNGGAAPDAANLGQAASAKPPTEGSAAPGNEIWIGPSGIDSNPGTKESPMASVSEAVKRMCGTSCDGKEGFTIWVLGGEYKPEKLLFISAAFSGAENKLNKLWAVPGEKPVFDCSATECVKDSGGTGQPCFFSHCLRVHGSYWHVKGLEITKARDGGALIAGSHNIIERLYTHHNDDTGLQIDVFDDKMFGWVVGESPIKEKFSGGGSHNLVLNCDSAFNFDKAKGGENADGFGAKKKKGEGNIFRGCRAWDNADDGYDFYEWGAQITLEGCWAMNSSKGVKGAQSDGNGFKLGPGPAHKLSNCAATGNRAKGFTYNKGSSSTSCTGCGSWSNGSGDNFKDIDVKSGPSSADVIKTERDADGNLPKLF